MSRYREVFDSRHVVLPVIHVESPVQAFRNARMARQAGADGVFLINHSMPDTALLAIHEIVADANPDWWVGVNCLGLSPAGVFTAISSKVGGVWTDNAEIKEDAADQPKADKVLELRRSRMPGCLYFGGVAFKYQRPVDDLEAACRIAAGYLDVVTTSGSGTDQAAELEKIRRMKAALGEAPLAIASGITPENVADFLPHTDCFLVATGISRSFTELDADKTHALIERVRRG